MLLFTDRGLIHPLDGRYSDGETRDNGPIEALCKSSYPALSASKDKATFYQNKPTLAYKYHKLTTPKQLSVGIKTFFNIRTV